MTNATRTLTWFTFLCLGLIASPRAQEVAPDIAPPATADPADRRPTVAVLEFDYGAVKEDWAATSTGRAFGPGQPRPTIDALNVGKGVADLLVSDLVDGGIRLLEREHLADVAREHEGGDAPHARYLITGAVTKFGAEDKNHSASAFALALLGARLHLPLAGTFSQKETFARVELSCRIVDARTGEIVGAANGAGQSRRSGLLLGGLVAGVGGHYSVSSANFQSTILGEATADAVKDAAAKIERVLARLVSTRGTQP
jgi:curli biogenesis system outer membrane secretion channel CsgG